MTPPDLIQRLEEAAKTNEAIMAPRKSEHAALLRDCISALRSQREALDAVRELGRAPSLIRMIQEAHDPRSHPAFPGIEVPRLEPTVYIEGYAAAMVKVMAALNGALAAAPSGEQEGLTE